MIWYMTRYMAWHCIALRCDALQCNALHCITLRCHALQCIALHCIALPHCIAFRDIALYCSAFHRISIHCIPFYVIVFQYTIRVFALRWTELHRIELQLVVTQRALRDQNNIAFGDKLAAGFCATLLAVCNRFLVAFSPRAWIPGFS